MSNVPEVLTANTSHLSVELDSLFGALEPKSESKLVIDLRRKLELERCTLRPFAHQVVGINELVQKPYFFLADEMGAGKTLQAIVAAQILHCQSLINRVIIVAPAAVRSVWYDETLGEITKHSWDSIPKRVYHYHSKIKNWGTEDIEPKQKHLQWIITNYEFVRMKNRLAQVLPLCTPRTMLILDESSAVKGHNTDQSKSCLIMRRACGRVVLLNGTPIANHPGDLFSQAQIMHPSILDCKSYFQFRTRYAIMGGYLGKQIVGWRDLEGLQQKLAPYVIRRLKEDCLDLPPKLPPINLEVPLERSTWGVYKAMKDEMVAWLSNSTVSTAQQTIVKAVRLAQITSGFLGGVTTEEFHEMGDWDGNFDELDKELPPKQVAFEVHEVGREKLDFFLGWLSDRLKEDPNFKVLVWGNFRPEVKRLYDEVSEKFKEMQCGLIWGGQKPEERDRSLQLLDPRTAPAGPVFVVGITSTGSMGLNLTAAHHVVYFSNSFNLKHRLQSEDRVHRPGQTSAVNYYDIIATGPEGQRTVDFTVVKSLHEKKRIADMTTSAWIQSLDEGE